MNILLLAIQTGAPEEIDFGILLLRTFFFLAIVLVLIYFVLRKVLPLLVNPQNFRKRTVKILERIPIDQKRSLLVIGVQDRFYLLGSAEGQINVLMELDPDKIQEQTSLESSKRISFDQVLKKIMKRTGDEEIKKRDEEMENRRIPFEEKPS